MRCLRSFLVIAALALLIVPSTTAQVPTGTITGTVTYEGAALPGVTVTATSPALQGERRTVSNANGGYIFRLLPPGEYVLSFELQGFTQLESQVRLPAAQTRTVDAEMYTERVTEEIEVTGSRTNVSSGTVSATTYDDELIESLPVGRDMENAVLLTPGTAATGPNNGITIAGAQSWENLFLINGVVVNENVRGQPFDLFIEDAIEETTTMTSGVSAEYGRFGGGVVNMITKSGGNEFSGSFRVNMNNDDWQASTPVTTSKTDDINQIYEATFGGYIIPDRLWFFLAGRDFEDTGSAQLYRPASIAAPAFSVGDEEQRYEGKLTFSPHVSHRVVGSYIEIDRTQTNDTFYQALDFRAIDPERTLPQELLAANYTGVLSPSFFVEAQYSERNFTFEDSGGTAQPGDRINGSVIYFPNIDAQANSMFFCGTCGDEERNNENILAKASYFWSSDTLGSHELVAGYDTFSDIRISNNYQSPSNFVLWNYYDPIYAGDDIYPVFMGAEGDSPADVDFWPIFVASLGTDFTTNSIFLNDTWRLNQRLSFNLGVRYDENDGVDGAGNVVADDSRISPRVGLAWDIAGDGDWIVNASYGRYVGAIANTVAGSAGGGTPSYFGYSYLGPAINADCDPATGANCLTPPEALAELFAWFDSVGGLGNTDLWYANPAIRGANLVIEGLDSTYADEYVVGFSKRLGNRGVVRADYVHREYGDFYATQRDISTGTVDVTAQVTEDVVIDQSFDLGYVVNEEDLLERTYDGLHMQASYRLSDNFNVGGTWTLSDASGNFEGETGGSGPVTSGILNYPEYSNIANLTHEGNLSIDQTHKVRLWGVWDAWSTENHNLSVSVLQNFWSGTPYGASSGRVLARPELLGLEPYVDNPGYLTPPTWTTYWFTDRDAFRTPDIFRTDLSVNYSFFWQLAGRDVEIFVQPEVLNVFNEQRAVAVDNAVVSVPYATFNPFTTTDPSELEEGVNYILSDSFGEPVREADYQLPRLFRVSVGFRF